LTPDDELINIAIETAGAYRVLVFGLNDDTNFYECNFTNPALDISLG